MPYVKKPRTHSIVLSVIVAGILLIVPASVSIGGNSRALADGYGHDYNGTNGHGTGNSTNTGADDDHGNSTNSSEDHGNSTGARSGDDHGNSTGIGSDDRENSTNDHPNNATSDNGRDNNQTGSSSSDEGHHHHGEDHDSVEGHGHSAYEREQNYVNETAESRHHEHLSFNETFSGPYTSNSNYTVTATGNATAISNESMIENASLTLHLSVWKSTHSVVSMDIMNGTIKIGNNQTQIYSGHAYYLLHHPRLLIYGFIVDKGIGSAGNSSSSEHSVRLLKLFMSADGGSLPVSSSDPPLQVTVLDPESKVASEWFLDMSGQVQRS